MSEGNNLVWPALIPLLTRPNAPTLFPDQTDNDTAVIETLFRLLDAFLELRQRPDSLTKIFREYVVWLEGYHARIDQVVLTEDEQFDQEEES